MIPKSILKLNPIDAESNAVTNDNNDEENIRLPDINVNSNSKSDKIDIESSNKIIL